jgi:hypothetical protein
MVHHVVHILADQLFGRKPDHPQRGAIDERAVAFQVDTPDALAGRIQQRLPGQLAVLELLTNQRNRLVDRRGPRLRHRARLRPWPTSAFILRSGRAAM